MSDDDEHVYEKRWFQVVRTGERVQRLMHSPTCPCDPGPWNPLLLPLSAEHKEAL